MPKRHAPPATRTLCHLFLCCVSQQQTTNGQVKTFKQNRMAVRGKPGGDQRSGRSRSHGLQVTARQRRKDVFRVFERRTTNGSRGQHAALLSGAVVDKALQQSACTVGAVAKAEGVQAKPEAWPATWRSVCPAERGENKQSPFLPERCFARGDKCTKQVNST